MNKVKGLVLVAGFAAFAAGACNQAASNANVTVNTAANVNKPASTPVAAASPAPEIASGKDLYTVNCMTCHKDSGKGGKVTVEGKTINPDDLTSDKMKAKSDDKLYGYISDGIEDEGMPAFKDKLKADDIRAIVKHVRDLQK